MSAGALVVVLGGTRQDRAGQIVDLLRAGDSTALILSSSPHLMAAGLDPERVELRSDDPAARLRSYLSGAVDPGDLVLAALATGSDSPLSAVLGWEYARRAVASGAWHRVVVDLDGTSSALRRLGAAAELAVFVDEHWPAHQRYAAMAAGDSADPAIREAHRLATTTEGVTEFLSRPAPRVEVAGESPEEACRIRSLAALARGAENISVTESGDGHYLARVVVPGECEDPAVEGDRLVLRVDGITLALRLPALLRRCSVVDWWVDGGAEGPDSAEDADTVVVSFLPDPELWPPTLHARVGAVHAG